MHQRQNTVPMRYFVQVMFVIVLLIPGWSKAENTCPWLNNATASGILNGSASLKMRNTTNGWSICLFRVQKQSSTNSLEIAVHPVKDMRKGLAHYLTQCTSPAIPLKGIGNEAEACSVRSEGIRRERVVGRVRDKLLIVSLSVGGNNVLTRRKKLLEENAQGIAEQVAGVLF